MRLKPKSRLERGDGLRAAPRATECMPKDVVPFWASRLELDRYPEAIRGLWIGLYLQKRDPEIKQHRRVVGR